MAKTVRHDEQLQAFWGEEDLLAVAQERSFAEMIFEMLAEKRPSRDELKIFELILNISIDHGPETPSAKAVVEAANGGANISEAVARGVEQITDTHGGAIQPAMEFFYRITREGQEMKGLVKEYLDNKRLIGGFGHRIYTVDPRSDLIFRKMEELGFDLKYVELARAIRQEVSEVKGREFPINIRSDRGSTV